MRDTWFVDILKRMAGRRSSMQGMEIPKSPSGYLSNTLFPQGKRVKIFD
jgi:hypothetical protein